MRPSGLINGLLGILMNEMKFLNIIKEEFYTKEFDRQHTFDSDTKNDHPSVIRIGTKRVGCIALTGYKNPDMPTVQITYFYIYRPNNGSGGIILKRLCKLADELGITLELDVVPPKPSRDSISVSDLTIWYGSHGFKTVFSRFNFMRREPNA